MRARLAHLWYGEGKPDRWGGALAVALWPLAWGFRLVVGFRNLAFDLGLAKVSQVEGARVVSVGNLNVGGVGKTPVVLFLADWALRSGRAVAVLSRGHGRRQTAPRDFDASDLPSAAEVGDEPRLIAQRLPKVRVFVGARRVDLARAAAEQGFGFLLLDDGMQHRQLGRAVELLVVDGRRGFGNGQLLPLGPLREPASALARADVIWLKEGTLVPATTTQEQLVVRARHVPVGLMDPTGVARPLSDLAGRRVCMLAGVGNPEGFKQTLLGLNVELVAERVFPDHHVFSAVELSEVAAEAASLGAVVMTTEKDAMRLPGGFEVWQVRLGVVVDEGLEALGRKLGLDPALSPPSQP